MLALFTMAGRADGIDLIPPVAEEITCESPTTEIPVREEQGSAGIMYNLAEHPESIRAVAKKLLGAAVEASAETHKSGCANGCSQAQAPTVVFRVTPAVLMPKEQQQALCLTLSEQTSKRPLTYGIREFPTVDELDNWIMAFSQGQGKDGELLYQQCGGNCDPSFTFVVTQSESSVSVQTEVHCGFARDRKNNLYNISTALRAECPGATR